MKSRVRTLAALPAAAIWIASAAAEPLAPRFELSWQAPGDCPEEAEFKSQVLRLAGTDARAEPELLAKVSIERSADVNWKLTLQTESGGRSGTRVLEGSSCGAVVDAAALTLALILNPEAAAPPSSRPPPEDPRVDTPAQPEPKPAPKAASEGPRVRLLGGAELGLHAGVMPSVGPDFGLGLGLAVGAGWVWLWGSYAPTQHATVDGQDAGGSLWMLSALGLGCWDVVGGSLVVAPCAGLELSRLQGTGEGVTDPQEAAIYWTSPVLGAALQLDVSRGLALRFSALGLVPLSRPALFLESIGEVHRPAGVAGRAHIGALVDFL